NPGKRNDEAEMTTTPRAPRRTHRSEASDVPEGPGDLRARGWVAVLKRTVREFRRHDLTDWAAALTYYGMLSIFPALIALVAVVGLAGQYPQTTNKLLEIVGQIGPASAVDTFRAPVESVVRHTGDAGILLVAGLLGALWSASGYIG